MSALSRKIAFLVSEDINNAVNDAAMRVREILELVDDEEIREKLREKIEVLLLDLSTRVAYSSFVRWKNAREYEGTFISPENADIEAIIKKILVREPKYRILQIIEEARAINKKDICKRVGISSSQLNKYLKELVESGFVKNGDKKGIVEYVSAPWNL